MKTIYKYPIKITDSQKISIPFYARILYAGLDPQNNPCIWAEVDSDSTNFIDLNIQMVGTGNELPNPIGGYLNSFNQGQFVWHAYFY